MFRRFQKNSKLRGDFITLSIGDTEVDAEDDAEDDDEDDVPKEDIIPVCFNCGKVPYYSKSSNRYGWCNLLIDETFNPDTDAEIIVYDDITNLRGMKLDESKGINAKCHTRDPNANWEAESTEVDLRLKISDQYEHLGFFVCNKCDRLKRVAPNHPKYDRGDALYGFKFDSMEGMQEDIMSFMGLDSQDWRSGSYDTWWDNGELPINRPWLELDKSEVEVALKLHFDAFSWTILYQNYNNRKGSP